MATLFDKTGITVCQFDKIAINLFYYIFLFNRGFLFALSNARFIFYYRRYSIISILIN
uniref:Uncharacterized protein n=1 Tax=Arsenophonus nasoniae TaxID=638 RepID=D2TWP1_9GAMM|nr:hypothetical protein ARN_04820 [Arsenophonus nasoniae]